MVKHTVTKYGGMVGMVKVSEISSHFSIITSRVTIALPYCSYIGGGGKIKVNYNNI